MTDEELLNFCEKREVEVFTHYDFARDSVIIKMRKKNLETTETVQRGDMVPRAFGLTISVILRRMADKLDEEAQG